MIRLARSLAACVVVSLAASPALAGKPEEEAKSRKLFKEAESLANDGRWKEACHLYQAAHDLNSTGGTALRTADCYEKIAEYDHALTMYEYVVAHAATDKLPERVKLAEGRVAALRKQLSKDPPPPVPGTPGSPPPQQPGPLAPTQTVTAPPPPPPRPNRVPAIVLLSVGGASAVAGGVLGALAMVQSGDIRSKCGEGSSCVPKAGYGEDQFKSDLASMNAKAWGANIAIGVAAVGVVVGVTLFALKVPKARVANALGPQGVTIRF